MRSAPRRNGSASVETNCGGELFAAVLDSEYDRLTADAGLDPHGAVFGQVTLNFIVSLG